MAAKFGRSAVLTKAEQIFMSNVSYIFDVLSYEKAIVLIQYILLS